VKSGDQYKNLTQCPIAKSPFSGNFAMLRDSFCLRLDIFHGSPSLEPEQQWAKTCLFSRVDKILREKREINSKQFRKPPVTKRPYRQEGVD